MSYQIATEGFFNRSTKSNIPEVKRAASYLPYNKMVITDTPNDMKTSSRKYGTLYATPTLAGGLGDYSLIAQINLSELPVHGKLPKKGLIQFLINTQINQSEPECTIVYINPSDFTTLVPVGECDPQVDARGDVGGKRITFKKITTLGDIHTKDELYDIPFEEFFDTILGPPIGAQTTIADVNEKAKHNISLATFYMPYGSQHFSLQYKSLRDKHSRILTANEFETNAEFS